LYFLPSDFGLLNYDLIGKTHRHIHIKYTKTSLKAKPIKASPSYAIMFKTIDSFRTAMANPRPLKLFNAALLQSLKRYFGAKSIRSLENVALEPIWVGHG
jgi:hypothetical protein